MVISAVEQKLRKLELYRWKKKQLWKVDTFRSADYFWNCLNNIQDALCPNYWKRQDLIVKEDSGVVHCLLYYQNPLECIQFLL